MDINQNIVKIRTATQRGTGIIYPCESRHGNMREHNYVIFTNRHLVRDISLEQEDGNKKNLLKYFRFDIYDKFGEKVECFSVNNDQRDDVSLELFYPTIVDEDKMEKQMDLGKKLEDIAVFLLTFYHTINLDLETKILWSDIHLEKISMEGFPEVLSDNEISSKLLVQGVYKSVFPSNDRIGIFQITDDYHWYNSYKDYRLFQGFSGSPIFQSNENGENRLLGMNQSVLNIDGGENPFKLMYYYKMPFILEYLRECGCILFSRQADDSAKIRWIYNDRRSSNVGVNDVPPNDDNPPVDLTLLLLGASGAGKSSFAKTFLLHSDYINSTNDGQTTRTNIIYEIGKFKNKPKVKVKFLNKENFVKRMKLLNYSNYLYKLCWWAFSEHHEDSIEGYLRYFCYDYSEKLKDSCKLKECKDEINELFYPKDEKERQNKRKDLEYRYYTDMLENLCEDIIEIKIRCDRGDANVGGAFDFLQTKLFLEHEVKIKSMLDVVEGFFDIHEFDFLYGESYTGDRGENKCDSTEKQKVDSPEPSKSIKGYFEDFYKLRHEELINKVDAVYSMPKNNYTIERNLDGTVDLDNLLTYSLQRKGKYSLTGIVESVYIEDSISNAYAFIFDELNIKKLKLIDTYGLDHADWNARKNTILMNIVFELNEANIIDFNSGLAVVYIKKLDSGKPTELKDIIPCIFELVPMAPIYCVFNGLDIYLGSDVNLFKDSDNYFQTVRQPKSYSYLKEDNFKSELMELLEGKNSGYINSLYSTMKNNLVSFCANDKMIKNNFNIFENNRSEIYKMLTSIVMDEYSSMNIVSTGIIDSIDSCKDEIKNFLKNVFVSSTIDWERLHWKTRQANFKRISEQSQLGYWGVYMHQWNQLFHMGYTNTVINYGENILGLKYSDTNKEMIIAVDACIRNMESAFLGDPKSLIWFERKCDKSKFRGIIEKMYNNKEVYKINPFDPVNEKDLEKYNDKEDIDSKNEQIKQISIEKNEKKDGQNKDRELEKMFLKDILSSFQKCRKKS